MPILSIENLCKSYTDVDKELKILNNLNLTMKKGDFVSVRGTSGAGKSTLLNIVGALDSFDSGKVIVNDYDLSKVGSAANKFRLNSVGFIFQHHHLLPDFTILENVSMPLLLKGMKEKLANEKSIAGLKKVGLEHRLDHYPSQISGGESQRVAVARAIVHEPPLVLADEPTGNLDMVNTNKFIDILISMQKEYNLTILVVTHEEELANKAPTQFTMKAGQLNPV